ncbi:uncharacterized protein Dwil_GK21773 [Drosophila willistoni]|uniref:Tetraspanin n=1 Tax=Drosophila willistoni TaxID=7260 RepID=B4MPV2_DROWI|nr:tetraspanin-1 [Drosophila willistoni]EDW74141.1 uncharacterized protein Dwil_GK21773 [Drosophila willistoni]
MNILTGIINITSYLVNILFLVVGTLLIVLGSIMLSYINALPDYDSLISSNGIPICILVLGGIILIVSFIGVWAIYRQSVTLTGTYTSLVCLLFILQLVMTCWVFVNRTAFAQDMSALVTKVWKNNDEANNYPMGALELAFECCGNTGWTDYDALGENIPGTCCAYTDRTSTCSASIYQLRSGCNAKFTSFWKDNTNTIGWAGVGLCIYELIVIILAGALAWRQRKANAEEEEE